MQQDLPPQRPAATRRPVIALMGEFSAGKSTLTNLLVGAKSLPVQVTATQLPPVWLSFGAEPPKRVDLADQAHLVDLHQPESIDLNDTQYLRVERQADILELCDLIDMPGISDPNMAAEVWQRALHLADAVIWCSHATQAWRQSEAAVWDMVPANIKANSILLLTRFDKITKDSDRARVLRRVGKEAAGQFAHILPISLLDALASGDDRSKWEASGAQDFVAALIDTIQRLKAGDTRPRATVARSSSLAVESLTDDAPAEPQADSGEPKVLPRRVRRDPSARRTRPTDAQDDQTALPDDAAELAAEPAPARTA